MNLKGAILGENGGLCYRQLLLLCGAVVDDDEQQHRERTEALAAIESATGKPSVAGGVAAAARSGRVRVRVRNLRCVVFSVQYVIVRYRSTSTIGRSRREPLAAH